VPRARIALVERSQGRLRPVGPPKPAQLATGVPADTNPLDQQRAAALVGVKRKRGKLLDSDSAKRLGSLGGHARAEKMRALAGMPVLLRRLGLRQAPEALLPYLADAEQFATAEQQRLAQLVGGGVCSPAASSFVQSAALQLAASRCAFSQGDAMQGSRLADASRANLLSAHELCAREAELRRKTTPPVYPWLQGLDDDEADDDTDDEPGEGAKASAGAGTTPESSTTETRPGVTPGHSTHEGTDTE